MINDTSKPLVLLGSNFALYKLTETCEDIGIPIAGIVDKDYYGNTDTICEVPIIGSEDTFFNDISNRTKYNFFCATNWSPENNPVHQRNKNKRAHLVELIEKLNLDCISIVDTTARVSRHATIGPGVFIDGNVLLEPEVTVKKFSTVMYNTLIGHHTLIGENCVIQRGCYIAADCILEDNVYVSVACKLLKPGAKFGENTFIHDGIYIRRSTIKNEVISMTSPNQKRVVHYISEDNND